MPAGLTGVGSPRAPSTLADDSQGAPSITALKNLFNNLGINDLESRNLVTSVVRLVTPAHRGSPNSSQATIVEDGFEVLSSPGPQAEDDDSNASELVTPQVTAAAVVSPSAVINTASTTSLPVLSNAVGTAAAAIASTTSLPALYAPGYVLPSSKPDNTILPPANLITPIYRYHTPSANSGGPFFCVSRGWDIGIFCGWEVTSPLVIGMSCSSFSRVASIAEGHRRMAAALTANFALYLT